MPSSEWQPLEQWRVGSTEQEMIPPATPQENTEQQVCSSESARLY